MTTDKIMRQLEPAIKKVWTIQAVIMTLVAAAVVFFFYDLPDLFRDNPVRWLGIPAGLLSLLIFVLGLTASFALPRLQYRYWRFDLRPEELYLERGILTRVKTIVPLRRIQHLDVSQNIIEREFELGRLVVYTAGTQSNNVVLPGLKYEEAEQLRNEVRHYILEDAV